MMARILFCLLPAIIVGLFGLLVHPIFSAVNGLAMFWLGWKVTEARPERGEHK
jgi:hypothetical protein